ncbi:MAG: hypothetical protein GF331_21295, partial [Chitinivibrionales bacterium]|nr:hypothetical protein [Chitinivibrionales bacterium]
MICASSRVEQNKQLLRSLYTTQTPAMALIYEPPLGRPGGELGDFTLSDRPVAEWVPWYVSAYEKTVRMSEELDDDGVPFVNLYTNTGLFAGAFGCSLHAYEG